MHTQESEDTSASTSSKIPESEVKSLSIAPDSINSNVQGITLVALIGYHKFNSVRSEC